METLVTTENSTCEREEDLSRSHKNTHTHTRHCFRSFPQSPSRTRTISHAVLLRVHTSAIDASWRSCLLPSTTSARFPLVFLFVFFFLSFPTLHARTLYVGGDSESFASFSSVNYVLFVLTDFVDARTRNDRFFFFLTVTHTLSLHLSSCFTLTLSPGESVLQIKHRLSIFLPSKNAETE